MKPSLTAFRTGKDEMETSELLSQNQFVSKLTDGQANNVLEQQGEDKDLRWTYLYIHTDQQT